MAFKIKPTNSQVAPPTKKSSTSWSDWMQKDIQLFGSGLSMKKKEAFYTELAVLLEAGLDIQSSLGLISENSGQKKDQVLFEQIRQHLISGDSLTEAMQQTDKFSTYEIYSLEIGESTGNLLAILKELSHFYTRSLQYQKQIRGALAYPVFVSIFAVVVVFFMLRFLVPMFSGMYKRFDGDLPSITKGIIVISEWLKVYTPYLIIGFILIIILAYYQRHQTYFRKWSARFLLKIPIFGSIIHKAYLARFCQAMSLLLGARVPLLPSLGLVRKMIAFYPLEQVLEHTEKQVQQGQNLHEGLASSSLFPKQFLALIRVGEEASQLDPMFQRLADQYNQEIDQKTKVLGNLLEPILIIFLGLFIGLILVAMYLPLFKLSTSFGI